MKKAKDFLYSILSFAEDIGVTLTDGFVLFLTSFISANYYTALAGDFTDLTYVRDINVIRFFCVFAVVFAALTFITILTRSPLILNWALLISSVLYAVFLCAQESDQIYFNIGVAFVLVFILKYVTDENRLGIDFLSMSRKTSFVLTSGIFVAFVVFVSVCTVIKYMTFAHSAFDFGIFCQMFEEMAENGKPFTTIERSKYLSHFAVHFSPVFYILLPGYMIFRSPIYLLVCQAIVVGLGVFPLRRICLKLGMTPAFATAAALVYAFFPTMANGCFYDFHENKFLSVFILYMIYFVLCEKNVGIFVFALAILSVKEDAAIYVMAIALWMLLTKRKRITAVILFIMSVVYFVFACKMIELSGGEIMMSRLDNYYIDPNGGFIDVIKTCFYDIAFLIKEVFLGADTIAFSEMTYGGQKIEFIYWLCIPLLFMPFASKRTTNLVLMIPLLVINLMPSWMYQYNINFQYTYGTAALVIVAAFLALSEKSPELRKRLIAASIVLCIVFSASVTYPKAERFILRYDKYELEYTATAEALDIIPHDASVTTYGFFAPYLSYIDDLRASPEYYAPYEKSDYYVVDIRYESDSHTDDMYEAMGDDYVLIKEGGYALIYMRKDLING